MELLERCLLLLIGGGVGFFLGFMTRSQMRIEKELCEMHEEQRQKAPKRSRDERGFMANRLVADLLYLVVLALTIFGLVRADNALEQVEQNAEEQEQNLCEAGTDSRNAQRDIVDAVWLLAAGLTTDRENEPPPGPRERAETREFIGYLNQFREDTYAKIKPSETCAPYVEDDTIEPEPISVPTEQPN